MDFDKAIVDFTAAIDACSKGNLDACGIDYLNRAHAFYGKGDFGRAKADLDFAASRYSFVPTELARFSSLLAYVDFDLGNFAEARLTFDKSAIDWENAQGPRALADSIAGTLAFDKNAIENAQRPRTPADTARTLDQAFRQTAQHMPSTVAYIKLWSAVAGLHAKVPATEQDAVRDLRDYWNAHRSDKAADWPFPLVQMFFEQIPAADILNKASGNVQQCQAQLFLGELYWARKNTANAKASLQVAVDTCPKASDEYLAAQAELNR